VPVVRVVAQIDDPELDQSFSAARPVMLAASVSRKYTGKIVITLILTWSSQLSF